MIKKNDLFPRRGTFGWYRSEKWMWIPTIAILYFIWRSFCKSLCPSIFAIRSMYVHVYFLTLTIGWVSFGSPGPRCVGGQRSSRTGDLACGWWHQDWMGSFDVEGGWYNRHCVCKTVGRSGEAETTAPQHLNKLGFSNSRVTGKDFPRQIWQSSREPPLVWKTDETMGMSDEGQETSERALQFKDLDFCWVLWGSISSWG